MKISRQKKIQKYINFYVNNFGFRLPYQILIDGTYCFAALKNKHNIEENLPAYFQANLKFLTTPCVVIEIEKLGKKVIGAMIILKKFGVHKCSHANKPVSGSDCIKSMVGKNNQNKYIIATQDRELQEYFRDEIIGVPLLYLHQKTPVFEHPTKKTIEFAKNKIENYLDLNKKEANNLKELQKSEGILTDNIKISSKKKKKKGPNPLSCKKPKKQKLNKLEDNSQNIEKAKKKRKRKKVKIPEHVKQELLK